MGIDDAVKLSFSNHVNHRCCSYARRELKNYPWTDGAPMGTKLGRVNCSENPGATMRTCRWQALWR